MYVFCVCISIELLGVLWKIRAEPKQTAPVGVRALLCPPVASITVAREKWREIWGGGVRIVRTCWCPPDDRRSGPDSTPSKPGPT